MLWGIIFIVQFFCIVFAKNASRRLATMLLFLPVAGSMHRLREFSYEQSSILQVASAAGEPTIVDAVIDTPIVIRRHPLADQQSRRDQSPWQTQIEVDTRQLRVGSTFEPIDGRLLVVVDGKRDELRPGDEVRAYGTLRRFSAPTNPGQRDLRKFYHRRGLHARLDVDSEAQLVRLDSQIDGGHHASRLIASIAARGRDLLLQHTGETGPLAVALVIGQRDFVDHKTRDLLLVTGTAHLLSVSGLHLAIVVALAAAVATLLRMPTFGKILWIILVCCLYTAITGGRPPVMRAAVLVGTFMFALLMKRPSQPINTLSLAAIGLVFLNPEFVFSIGVQLSFLAVATLVLCGLRREAGTPALAQAVASEEQLELLVEGARSRPLRIARSLGNLFRQATWFSACVTAISLPLVWHQFHVVSPISVVTNVVLGPCLFVALATGVATVVLGFMYEPLAILPGLFCQWSLAIMRWIIETAADVPGGHFWLPAPPSWWVAAFYLVIAATLCIPRGRRATSIRYGWIATWIIVAWILATTKSPLPKGHFEATFVDVGHGTSVVLRFADDDVWLYDCGRLGNDTHSSRDIDVTLWSLGVTRLDGIFLSHADADHFNALPGVLRRFRTRQIITPPGMLSEPEPALASIREAIEDSGAVVSEHSGETVSDWGDRKIRVLHPPRERLPGSDNANSLVLRIDRGGRTLILPGDLEPPGTASLIGRARPPPGGVLMAPHHGSLRMDASSVLQWSRPRETIVSGGRRARRPEVYEMLAATGSGVHVTSHVGAIRVRIDAQGKIEVRSWVQSPW